MPECETCGYFEDENSAYIADNVCLSCGVLSPIRLKKDIFGKFIPHKDCPEKKSMINRGWICGACGQVIHKK